MHILFYSFIVIYSSQFHNKHEYKIIIQGQLLLLNYFLLNSSSDLKREIEYYESHIKYRNYCMSVLYSVENLSVPTGRRTADRVSYNANATIKEAGAPKQVPWPEC